MEEKEENRVDEEGEGDSLGWQKDTRGRERRKQGGLKKRKEKVEKYGGKVKGRK